MKRLIVCCDGTWQQLSSSYPTNVIKIAQIIKPKAENGIPQIVYYQSGLGTKYSVIDRVQSGAFGLGIDIAIQEAYSFLCLNYQPGDDIYLFGFSRGAYTVRSLAGLIYNSGLLDFKNIRKIPEAYLQYRNKIKPNDDRMKNFRDKYSKNRNNVPIKLLGCWDTVGALGIPKNLPLSDFINGQYKFHDTKINRKVENALHAVAIDEQREVFELTPMEISNDATTRVHQVWFPGTHGCIGGGTEKLSGLSDAALLWMMNEINQLDLGLEFVDNNEIVADYQIKADHTIEFDSEPEGLYLLGGVKLRTLYSANPTNNHDIYKEFFDKNIHESTKKRWLAKAEYRPDNLAPYKKFFNDFSKLSI